MADLKFQQLPSGTPIGTDIFPFVQDPGGSPADKKTTFTSAFSALGAVSGSGAGGQIAFWDGSSSIAGSDSLLWDDAQKELTIIGKIAAGNAATFADNKFFDFEQTTTSFSEDTTLAKFIWNIESAADIEADLTVLDVRAVVPSGPDIDYLNITGFNLALEYGSNGSISEELRGALMGVEFNGAPSSQVPEILGVSVFAIVSSGISNIALNIALEVGVGILDGATCTITDNIGLSIYQGDSGTITNNYGIKLDDLTVGDNNWAIFTGLGQVQFGDDTTVLGSFIVTATGSSQFVQVETDNDGVVGTSTGSITFQTGTPLDGSSGTAAGTVGEMTFETGSGGNAGTGVGELASDGGPMEFDSGQGGNGSATNPGGSGGNINFVARGHGADGGAGTGNNGEISLITGDGGINAATLADTFNLIFNNTLKYTFGFSEFDCIPPAVFSSSVDIQGRLQGSSAAITAANNLTLGTANLNIVSGNTQINALTTAGWTAGSQITLIFSGTPTIKNNTAGGGGTAVILLSGSADLLAAANTVLGLIYDGTQWQETFRKTS